MNFLDPVNEILQEDPRFQGVRFSLVSGSGGGNRETHRLSTTYPGVYATVTDNFECSIRVWWYGSKDDISATFDPADPEMFQKMASFIKHNINST